MILPVISLFIILSIFSLFENERQRYPLCVIYILIFVWLILVIIATFRSNDMHDYYNYVYYFKNNLGYDANRFEPGFQTLTSLFKVLNKEPLFLFFLFAVISIGIKLFAIRKMTNFISSSLLIYISYLFILHDMIQIRCAISSGLLLFCVNYIVQRNFLKFLTITFLAVLFHYSALIIFPLWFLDTKKPQKILYIIIIPLAYLAATQGLLFGTLIKYIPVPAVQMWVTMHNLETIQNSEIVVNIWGRLQLLRCCICLFIIMHVDLLQQYNKVAIILSKIYSLALVLFVVLSDIPVISWRISEFLFISEIILLPLIIYIFKKYKFWGKILIIIIGGVLSYVTIFNNKLLL